MMLESAKIFLQARREDYRAVNKKHLIYLLTIFFNTFAFGVVVSIYGVTMEDVRQLYGSQHSVMPLLMILNSVGYVVGTLIGPLYRWLNRQLVLGTFTFAIALITTFIPLYNPIPLAFGALWAQGVCMGVYGSSFQIWFRQMFPRRLNTLLNVNQFMYGLGTMTAPALAGSFLYGNSVVEHEVRQRSIMVPYLISGAIQMLASSLLFILFLTNRYYEPESEAKYEIDKSEMETPPSISKSRSHPNLCSTPSSSCCSTLSKASSIPNLEQGLSTTHLYHPSPSPPLPVSYRKTKLSLCTLFLALYYTSENGYLPYSSTMWQNLPLKLDSHTAAHVQTVLSMAYTLGPLVTAFVSLTVIPDIIIAYHFGFLIVGLAILAFGQASMPLIYLGSALFGYGMSAMVATIYSFADRHFQLNNRVTTAFSLTNGLFFLTISSILTVYSMDKYPNILFKIVAAYIALSLALFIVIRSWISISK